MTKFNLNNLRLFIKTLVTAWVPVAVLTGIVTWDADASVLIMGASTLSIDALFRVWSIQDPPTP